MRNIIFTLGLAIGLNAAASTGDENIKFCLLPLETDEIPTSEAQAIDLRLARAMTRTDAVTKAPGNVFAIRPAISVGENAETEGMVMEIGRVKADLTISAVNTADGMVFHSVTIPLKGSSTGGRNAAMKAMTSSLNPNDPVFVRFVRRSREKIEEYYAANCASIVSRAAMLADTGRREEALSMLGAISPALSCYDAATEIIAHLSSTPEPTSPDTVLVEKVVEVPSEPEIVYVESAPDTVVVEKVVERVVERPVPQPQPQPQSSRGRIKINYPDDFSFRVITCAGNTAADRIKIVGELVNHNINYNSMTMGLNKAFDANGVEYGRDSLQIRDRYSTGVNMPKGIPIKIEFSINGATPSRGNISYAEITFGKYRVEIYDLPVAW